MDCSRCCGTRARADAATSEGKKTVFLFFVFFFLFFRFFICVFLFWVEYRRVNGCERSVFN